MPRYPLHPATGTGIDNAYKKAIRLVKYGCANRPFYHIVVMDRYKDQRDPPIEQLGTYDPMVNQYNEKIVSFNFERLKYWIGQPRVKITTPIAELLGLAGFYPIHPYTYIVAWRNRRKEAEKALETNEKEAAKNT